MSTSSGADLRTVVPTYAVGGDPRVTSTSDEAGTVTAATDLVGNVVSYTDVWGVVTRSVFDRFGRVVSASNPGGVLESSYDIEGRVTLVRLNGDVGIRC